MVEEVESSEEEKQAGRGQTSWVQLGVSLGLILVGGWFAIQSGRMVYNYNRFTNEASDLLAVVPVEAKWRARWIICN